MIACISIGTSNKKERTILSSMTACACVTLAAWGVNPVSNDAKRAANQRYLRSLVTLTIRLEPDQAAAVRAYAAARHTSVNRAVLDALRGTMAAEGIYMPPGRKDAQKAIQSLSGPLPGQVDLFGD